MSSPLSASPVILLSGVSRYFHQGDVEIRVLEGLDFHVARGERIAIVGASGAGKSTLLHLMGGLDQPTSGVIQIDGHELVHQSERELAQIRNRSLGFVYQFHHLLPEFTALENVAMPLLIRRGSVQEARDAAQAILTRVGLEDRLHHKPGEMSGGERQRAAVARAMVTHPSCLLADEPTGNLDQKNSTHIYELLLELNTSFSTALVVVTHDLRLAQKMDRCFEMKDGQLHELT